MRSSRCIWAAAVVIGLVSTAGAQTVVVYDPTQTVTETKMTRGEQGVFDSVVLPAAKRAVGRDVCEADVTQSGVARGAFTKAGANQSLVFYQYCQTGNGFGQVGLVLMEGDRLLANFMADAGWTVDIGRVADINKNGLDEFYLVYSGGLHQGQGGTGVDLMEFAAGSPRGIGWYQAEKFDETQATTAWALSVKPGLKPVYYRQKYFSGEGEDYKPQGKAAAFILGKAVSKFRAIR